MIYGERFKQIRELNRWTQAELAAKLNTPQSFIAKIEGDRAHPPPAFVEGFCVLSGFPPEFFGREPELDFPAGSLLFRSHSVMTKTDAIEMYRYAQIEFGVMRDMLRKKRFKPFALTLPTNVGDDSREAAELTRNSLGIGPYVPIRHLTSVLEKAGVLMLALPKPFPHREAFSLWAGYDRQRPVIVLSGGASGDRLRLSIAHELGHLVMHKPVANPVREIEKQAYRFAAEFLLPEAAMRQELVPPLTLDSFVSLKTRWGVSIQALIVHARDLEIITDRKYTYLFQQLSRRGWRNREPRMFDVPLEKPRAVRQVAEMIYGTPIRYKKLAEDVSMPEPLVRMIIEAHATKKGEPETPQESNGRGRVTVFPAIKNAS